MEFPNVRKLGTGAYAWMSSEEARSTAKKATLPALDSDQVHQRAEATARENGLRDPSLATLRHFYEIQVGKYQGQTFRWLVENDMGYTTYLVCSVEADGGCSGSGPINNNKRQLKEFMESFPDGIGALRQRRRELDAEARKKKMAASRLVSSFVPLTRLPDSQVARRLIASPKKKMAKTQETTSDDMDDRALLEEVECLEATQPSSQPLRTPPSTPTRTKTTKSPSTSGAAGATTEPLSDLRASSSLLESLSQPDEYPLPSDWKRYLPEADRKWISKALVRHDGSGKIELRPTKLWYHPPQPQLIPSQCPSIDRYFVHSLFVWMPRLLWRVPLSCVNTDCAKREIARAGTYPVVRQVLALDAYYFMVTERYECTKCKAKYVGWSGAMVDQLDVSRRVQFPVLLTYRYACDLSVVSMLRNRGLGNSSSQLQRKLEEEHNRRYLGQAAHYLSDCSGFASSSLVSPRDFARPPAQAPVPKSRWLQHVYCLDVLARIDEVRAAITSTFGRVLKLDSTKKVVKKLAGRTKGMAAWATNIGNEDGQVLNSVLTCEEGHFGLTPMVEGIVKRYADADVPPPEVIYVDRDCCGQSFTRSLFRSWPDMEIRLDIWHFMRRFSAGCSTDAHQLYGVFMARLSKCIFEWSRDDLHVLRNAKRSELLRRSVEDPSDEDVLQWLTKRELALHCRRRTRGADQTTRLIGELIDTLMGPQGLDTLGVPLFDREKMVNIWESQRRHISCIQDPDGIQLYTKTGTLTKGGVRLPKYRCARGSVSLESFHNHLAKFIPGTTASETHFQAFLLDGLQRWNEDRTRQMSATAPTAATYSGLLRHAVNELSVKVLKEKLVPEFRAPRAYTGEKIGVEYLFAQTGAILQDFLADPEDENLARFEEDDADSVSDGEDEGFEDLFEEDDDPTQPPVDREQLRSPAPSPVKPANTRAEKLLDTNSTPTPETNTPPIGDQQPEREDQSDAVDADNIGGFDRVDRLAEYLFSLRDQTEPISRDQADHIINLWNNLSDFDKQPTVPSPRHRTRLTKGSVTTFKVRSKESFVPGVDSVKRAFHGTEGGIAQRPDSNRYMELLIVKLCSAYPSPVKESGKRVDRWTQVSRAYRHIRELFLACCPLAKKTRIVLFEINNATLNQWFTKRTRDQERAMLLQNIRLPEPPMVATSQLPEAKVRDPLAEAAPVPPGQEHPFVLPPYAVNMSGKIRKPAIQEVSETPANPEAQVPRVPLVPRRPRPVRPILPAPAVPPEPAPPKEAVPRSTKWYRKQQEKKTAAGEYVRKYERVKKVSTCSKCGSSRTPDTHKQYYGHWYCPTTTTESYVEWRSSREKCMREAKLRKKQLLEEQKQQEEEQ